MFICFYSLPSWHSLNNPVIHLFLLWSPPVEHFFSILFPLVFPSLFPLISGQTSPNDFSNYFCACVCICVCLFSYMAQSAGITQLKYRSNRRIPARASVWKAASQEWSWSHVHYLQSFCATPAAHLFYFDLFQLPLLLNWDEMRNKGGKKR